MEVKRYIFQSPYPSQVQIGREDPTVKTQQKMQQQTTEEIVKTVQQPFENKPQETPLKPTLHQVDIYV